MDLDVIARLAAFAKKQSDLDETINTASRHATPDQLKVLKEIKKSNSYRLAVARREGTLDFDGRVSEALRVLETLYSLRNGKATGRIYPEKFEEQWLRRSSAQSHCQARFEWP